MTLFGLELVIAKWVCTKLSAGLIYGLVHSSTATVTHFAMHAASATMATATSAGSATAAATAVGASAIAAGQLTYKVIKKRQEKGLDENSRPLSKTSQPEASSSASAKGDNLGLAHFRKRTR